MLNNQQKRRLKAVAHTKKPVVIVGGNGVSEALLAELERALYDHELLKIRINAADRDERETLLGVLLERTGAALVQRIGHVAVLYRPRPAG